MRPIQQIYYDHEKLFCPRHGSKYISFHRGEEYGDNVLWRCDAVLPSGLPCGLSAAWNTVEDIEDSEVKKLQSINRNLKGMRIEPPRKTDTEWESKFDSECDAASHPPAGKR